MLIKVTNVETPAGTKLKYQKIQSQLIVIIETGLYRKKSQRHIINLIA